MLKRDVPWRKTLAPYAPMILFAVAILVLAGGTMAFLARVNSQAAPPVSTLGPAPYLGTDLKGTPAPDFTLQDQTGATVALKQFRGHPVVLTFFDSVCPHQDCSLMAEYINATAADLGQGGEGAVAWVAVSLNPWHDTPASATTFLQTRQVRVPLHYLLGTEKQLAPIWQGYHMQSMLQPDGVVIHTTGVFLIDGQGRERTFFEEGFDPKVASQAIHTLLAQSPTAAQPTQAPAVSSAAFTGTATASGYRVALTATPGQFGTYDFMVTVQDPSGTPLQGARVRLDLMMPAMAMSPLAVKLAPTDPPIPGSYQARGVLSMAGAWQATVSVTPSGSSAPVTATFSFTTKF